MDYSDQRQIHHLKTIPKNEIELMLKNVVEHFTIEWLEKSEGHPLHKLWARKDYLATNELLNLGSAIEKMRNVDSAWLNHQIKRAKSLDRNNRIGAFFEILGLSHFNPTVFNIKPATKNQKGFDGIIVFHSGANIRLSLKNYGESYFLSEFTSKSKELENHIRNILKSLDKPPVNILIDTLEKYPDRKQWKDLFDNIHHVIRNFDNDFLFNSINKEWNVYISPLSRSPDVLHARIKSFTLITVASYHKNEKKNLFDKLDEACYNLAIHSKTEDAKTINVAYIHLPMTASIFECAEWSKTYFDNKKSKPISGIILYQPTVATDVESNSTTINHCCVTVFNERFNEWSRNNNITVSSIEINFQIGIVSRIPTEMKIRIGDKMLNIHDKYVFQTGDHYILATKREDGTTEGTLGKLASGITTHLVFSPIPGEEEIIITPHLPKEDSLLIL